MSRRTPSMRRSPRTTSLPGSPASSPTWPATSCSAPPRVPPAGRRFGPVTRFGDLWLLTPPSVFAPRSDAQMLLDAAAGRVRGRVLDLCTGSGVLALSVQPRAEEVTAVDASRAAALA